MEGYKSRDKEGQDKEGQDWEMQDKEGQDKETQHREGQDREGQDWEMQHREEQNPATQDAERQDVKGGNIEQNQQQLITVEAIQEQEPGRRPGTGQEQGHRQGKGQVVYHMGVDTENGGNRWTSTKRIKKFIWGVLFLLGAVALILGKLGYLAGLGETLSGLKFWPVCLSVILLGIFIDGIAKRSFGTMLFSLAFLIIVNDKLLHLEALTPWTVLGVAALGTIGLNFIFPRRRRWPKSWSMHDMRGHGSRAVSDGHDVLSGEKVHYDISFGSAVKYISGQVGQVSLESSFGDLGVYFNGAILKDHQATAYVECSFGNMELFVPSDWKVVLNVANSFGGVEESGHCNPDGENVLHVVGEVSFGHLQVTYI